MTAPIFAIVRRYRSRFARLIPVIAVAAALENLTIAALYPLLSSAIGTVDAEIGGPLLGALGRSVASFPAEQRIVVSAALFLVLVPLNVAGKFLREWSQVRLGADVMFDVKQKLFRRLIQAPQAFLLARKPGEVSYRLVQAPVNLALGLSLVVAIGHLAVTSVVTVILLVSIEPIATLVMLAVAVAYFLASRYIARTHSVRAGREKLAALSAETGLAAEFLVGAREIDIARTGRIWAERVAAQSAQYRGGYIRDYVAAVSPGLLLELLVFAGVGLVIVGLKLFAADALVTLLPLLAVYVYALRQLLGSLAGISRQALRVAGLAPDIALVEASLNETYPEVRAGSLPLVPAWSGLRLERVSFTYPGADRRALDVVSFTIPARGTTALVGRSGSGKSTLLYLVLRLFDPSEGTIAIDSVDVGDIRRDAWLEQIGYVGQEPFIHHATVAENIAFGRPCSPEEVRVAAVAAHADGFIRALPDGYGTVLSDRGQSLSVGQRQRLAIARALVRQPRLLLLDEVTSALDPESERLIQATLADVARGSAVLMVAHRMALVRSAEQIVVLDAGRVVERGTHDELMASRGGYARLLEAVAREAAT